MLQFICNDSDNSKWYYDKSINKYVRSYGHTIHRRISPKNLPNPDDLLEARIQNAIRQGNIPNIEAMRPTKAVCSLWKHKLANSL